MSVSVRPSNQALVNLRSVITQGLLSPSVTERVKALKLVEASKDPSWSLKLKLMIQNGACVKTLAAAQDALFECDTQGWLDMQKVLDGKKKERLSLTYDPSGVLVASA